MIRAVIDLTVLDGLTRTPAAYEAVEEAVIVGQLDLLVTHVTIDELAEVPDAHLRASLLLSAMALGRLVPTAATVDGVSRSRFARPDHDAEAAEALRSGDVDHCRDLLIVATARYERCAVLTDDRRLAKQARERGLTVLSSDEMLTEIGHLLP